MGKFSYRVKDENAKVMEGVLEAPSEAEAQSFLTSRQYEILSLRVSGQKSFDFTAFLSRFETVNPSQFNFFVRQLSTLLKAGVPLLTAIGALEEEMQDRVLKRTLEAVHSDVEEGMSFSQSIARHPKIFSTLFISTVRAGEAIGELDTVLLRLSDILEKDYRTRQQIKAAMRYPMILVAVMFAAFLIAALFIIPRFKDLFAVFGSDLPLPTKILMGSSNFIKNYWYLCLAAMIGGGSALNFHMRTPKGKRFWHGLFLKAGFVGVFIKFAVFSRFSRMLGMMLKSGVNILQALELIAEIVGNAIISDSIIRIREMITQGESLSNQMRKEKLYPSLLIQMVSAGEASGKMDELLAQIAEYYDGELDLMVQNLEALIEPIFILMLGVFVVILAFGIFLPMWELYGVIAKQAEG